MIVIRDTLAVLFMLVVMIRLSPQLTLLIGVVGPVIALVVSAMSRAFRRYSSRIQHSMGDVTKITEQSLHGHRVVKIFEGQEHERRQFDDVNVRNFRANVRLVAVQAVGDSLTQYAVALGVAAVMYWSFSDLDAPSFIGFITRDGHAAHAAEAPDQHQRRRAARHHGGREPVPDARRAARAGHGHARDRARARRRRISRRLVQLRREQRPRAARREPRGAGGHDARARRPIRQRQVDAREPAAALL